jgi:cellulose synthase/poly-beta-1,6-N-acetylglucosamine synthase-like glycosyltransferase
MYLAEDRILSLGIYCQQDRKYHLQYVPDAIAYTDPMKSHEQLMIQRRRWINSSYFAFMYVFRNYYYNAMESNHNFLRKYILLSISMFLALLSFVNGYLIPSFYVFALYTTIVQSGSNLVIQYAAEILTLIYIFMIILSVTWSLFGTEWTKKAHIISYVFSFYTIMLMALVIYNVTGVYLELDKKSFTDIFNSPESGLVFVITCMNILSYLVIALVHLPTHCNFVFKLLFDCISYLTYQGAYSHVMLIYAFCNVDNVSWGTKGNSGKRVQGYLIEKVSFIADWLLYNAILAFLFLYIDFFMPRPTQKGIVLLIIGVYAATIIFFKVLLATIHHLNWALTERCCRKLKIEEGRIIRLK